ncbi:diacylglycerol lipase-alpha isoform X2 [Harmonia axyridis]|uniref:diacylglycerol lipase-alpha isoform X2 n=1 Tax=Harmonia axyridis TaxID=115357 RepID=UPI001E278010|nr:diacylglycerol lipase-alpha isoform X2 [Harmonia axyridis]
MPGLVAFRRRWSVGSDDLVVPGVFLFTMHLIWTIVLTLLLIFVHFDKKTECVFLLWWFIIGYMIILVISMLLESMVAFIALKGTILDQEPREPMQYVLYVRIVVMLIEGGWLSAGVYWLVTYYKTCQIEIAKEYVLGLIIFNWCLLLSVLITVWCTYDAAGRSWVKMKQYQKSMREMESKYQYKRSNSTRNWRQRKVLRAYQDRWQQRCKFLFCCYSASDRNRNSFSDIAKLLSDFFRDLDVVPSDVLVGLVLLRKFQKIERKNIIEQKLNDTYEYLSGVPVTPRTQFLSLHEGGQDLELFQTVIHFAHFAVHAYGWPMYVMNNKLGFVKVCSNLTCCCFPCNKSGEMTFNPEIINDNCCKCNYAVLQKLCDEGDIEIVYATYHCDVGETPFFIALDYDRKKVVISIRGTLSMQDILTDLNAEGETIPLDPIKEDWLGHKGMVQAAQYIYNHLENERLIEAALQHNLERGTNTFQLIIVGHSLGAGTASILGILLRQQYENLECYCYAPPGGLLSMPAVEYSKKFTISVVVGKDVVPRIGLHQMEALRADLITAIKRSVDPKWKTITCSIICCGCIQPTSVVEMSEQDTIVSEYSKSKKRARKESLHPSDSSIALTSHHPLYPPGRIIHVVRHHPTKGEQAISKKQPVYQALWAQNVDFDEVIISPVMIQDHMPDRVLSALQKVITTLGPRKPQRISSISSNNYGINSNEPSVRLSSESSPKTRLYLETSFTSLQSPTLPTVGGTSNASSITNGYHSAKSHSSPIQINNVLTMLGHDTISDFNLNIAPSRQPKSLSLNIKTTTSPVNKFDLIHDDWFGLAPLASPESLSEISVISSRASFMINSTDESACQTPKLMKRTLKIIGNLSTCADDIVNVRNFQKVETFARKRSMSGSHSSNSDTSFESAVNGELPRLMKCDTITETSQKVPDINSTGSDRDDFQSAEDILDNVLISAGCKEFFNSTPSFLETHFDIFEGDKQQENPKLCRLVYQSSPTLLSPNTPEDLDQDLLSNLAIDLNLQESNRSMHIYSSKSNSVDSGSTCRTPSDSKNVTFNPQVINIEHIPLSPKKKDRWQFFRARSNPSKMNSELTVLKPRIVEPPKTILCTKRRKSEEDFFARTEALPLLSGLTGNFSESSSGYIKRKNHVFPSDVAIMNKPNESSV